MGQPPVLEPLTVKFNTSELDFFCPGVSSSFEGCLTLDNMTIIFKHKMKLSSGGWGKASGGRDVARGQVS